MRGNRVWKAQVRSPDGRGGGWISACGKIRSFVSSERGKRSVRYIPRSSWPPEFGLQSGLNGIPQISSVNSPARAKAHPSKRGFCLGWNHDTLAESSLCFGLPHPHLARPESVRLMSSLHSHQYGNRGNSFIHCVLARHAYVVARSDRSPRRGGVCRSVHPPRLESSPTLEFVGGKAQEKNKFKTSLDPPSRHSEVGCLAVGVVMIVRHMCCTSGR